MTPEWHPLLLSLLANANKYWPNHISSLPSIEDAFEVKQLVI